MVSKMMLQPDDLVETDSKTRFCTCPTCKTHAVFSYVGEQHWPPRYASSRGIPTRVTLWQCSNCHSNISDDKLNKRK